MEFCYRLVRLQGILVTIVIGFIAAVNTGSSFFYTCSVAVFLPYFCRILLYSASYNIFAKFCLPYSAIFCQPYSAKFYCRYRQIFLL